MNLQHLLKNPQELTALCTLIIAALAFLTILFTVYLEFIKPRRIRPILLPFFNEDGKYPYFRKIGFARYSQQPLNFRGEEVFLHRPGFNARIKIFNDGKSLAKGVQAKVEKIEINNNDRSNPITYYYHPTVIKWSGERSHDPVDIIPKSHFFLDLFWSINETHETVINFNYQDLQQEIEKEIIEEWVQKINPVEDVYWNVWVDTSFERGIHSKFRNEGEIIIHITINAENCDPIKIKITVDWEIEKWNQPKIRVLHKNKWVRDGPKERKYELRKMWG